MNKTIIEEKDYIQTAKHLIAMWEDKKQTIYDTIEKDEKITLSQFNRHIGRVLELDNCIMDMKIYFNLIEVNKCK